MYGKKMTKSYKYIFQQELDQKLVLHEKWLNLPSENVRQQQEDLRLNLSEYDLSYLSLSASNFRGAILNNSNLSNVDLRKTTLEDADLYGANLNKARLMGANLKRANLTGTNLEEADFSESDLQQANIASANLKGTVFEKANLLFTIFDYNENFGLMQVKTGKEWREAIYDGRFNVKTNSTQEDLKENIYKKFEHSSLFPLPYEEREILVDKMMRYFFSEIREAEVAKEREQEYTKFKLELEKLKKLPYCENIDSLQSDYSCMHEKKIVRLELDKDLIKILEILNTSSPNSPLANNYNTGVKVDGGWIVGANAGEFGGSLDFVNKDNEIEALLDHPILGLYETPAGLIAVIGLNHLGTDFGYLYRIEKIEGIWFANHFANLCACPIFVEPKEDGSVVICNRYGSFLINEKGFCKIRINHSSF
jgi:hypothetical protein